FFTQTFLGSAIWGGGLMVVGYVLGARWDLIETKLKRVDLAVGLLIVLALVALGLRFYLRRRRAASSDSAV
ncbi:MAG TPA: hypothetical protein VGM90_28250, partial [Kofleriaceae bacterium]